jgi:peptidoglycan/xylan/chitin deacetylase (PgdA/CDA1 family)
MKHRIKLFLRNAWARLLFHTGLERVVDALMPRRLTILAGHCVTAPSNARLPKDMKIAEVKLERMLAWLARRYEVATVGDGLRGLASPPRKGGTRSLLALSMDDGYLDNRTHLLPLLARLGLPATVYLESRPLEERRVNWSHKFFWILDRVGPKELIRSFGARCQDAPTVTRLEALQAEGLATAYHLKRALKYDAPPAARNRAIEEVFAALGGDERALCDELYMTWADAVALKGGGVELGGHTVNHEILSRLDAATAEREVREGREAIRRRLDLESASFAFPFGRRWDYDAKSKEAVRKAGFASATTTHAGTNRSGCDPYELKRIMIDEDAELHLVAAEACGGFDLLRVFGLDLSE